jgi:hypothetical protein
MKMRKEGAIAITMESKKCLDFARLCFASPKSQEMNREGAGMSV